MPTNLTEEERSQVQAGIKEKYVQVAALGAGCGFQYPTGKKGLQQQAYPQEIIKKIPPAILEAFCGVGNPFSLGPINPGESVLDIGCGTGVDSLVAAHLVGPTGKVVGLDLTAEMINRARMHLSQVGLANVVFQVGEAESLPFEDNEFEVIISNGVLNLVVDKVKALSEVFRVLKPGGRLLLADQVLVGELPQDIKSRVENWAR